MPQRKTCFAVNSAVRLHLHAVSPVPSVSAPCHVRRDTTWAAARNLAFSHQNVRIQRGWGITWSCKPKRNHWKVWEGSMEDWALMLDNHGLVFCCHRHCLQLLTLSLYCKLFIQYVSQKIHSCDGKPHCATFSNEIMLCSTWTFWPYSCYIQY